MSMPIRKIVSDDFGILLLLHGMRREIFSQAFSCERYGAIYCRKKRQRLSLSAARDVAFCDSAAIDAVPRITHADNLSESALWSSELKPDEK